LLSIPLHLEIISVARLESGFPSLQKKAWFQSPGNKKKEGYYPSEENLPKCSSIILKIFIGSTAIIIFLAAINYTSLFFLFVIPLP
jgi:hypothetical protein